MIRNRALCLLSYGGVVTMTYTRASVENMEQLSMDRLPTKASIRLHHLVNEFGLSAVIGELAAITAMIAEELEQEHPDPRLVADIVGSYVWASELLDDVAGELHRVPKL